MKRFLFFLLVCVLSIQLIAQESVTVTANSEDIANNLDLNLVASLFGQASDVEEFETLLNNPDSTFSNLDLNGDGQVDYLRVVESFDGNKRLVIIQAVLAKDIFQDVASIYLEKNESTNEVSVQVIGDKFIYGDNYIITPVYLYRPVIYSWLWSSIYMPYCSPWYWDHYPFYWRHWHCITYHDYWRRCYHWHHHHHYCSFHHHHHPHHGYYDMYHRSGMGRHDYATHHPDRSYGSGVYRRGGAPNTVNESVRARNTSDNRFGSSNVRGRSQSSEASSIVSNSRTSASSDRSAGRSVGEQRIQSTSTRTASTSTRTSASSGRATGRQRTQSTSVSRSTGGQTGCQRIQSTSASSTRGSVSIRASSASSSRRSGGGSHSSGGGYSGSSSSSRQSTGSSRSSGARTSSRPSSNKRISR